MKCQTALRRLREYRIRRNQLHPRFTRQKSDKDRGLKAAIHKVLAGGMYLSEKMASSVISKLMRGQPEQPPASLIDALSHRELEVFRMLGQGKGVRHIAEQLAVTVATVNSFRNRIKEKLGLKSSTEVMLHAIQWPHESTSARESQDRAESPVQRAIKTFAAGPQCW